MKVLGIIVHYLHWHYTKAFGEIFRLWTNILWFIKEFFSFSVLLKTLVTPWKRLSNSGSGGVSGFFEGLIITTIMRIVGVIIRLVTFVFGLVCLIIAFAVGIIFIGVWPILPFVVFLVGVSGLWAIIKNI